MIAMTDITESIPRNGRSPLRQFSGEGAITREIPTLEVSIPGAIITSFGRDTSVGVLPERIDGYKVVGIADNAFSCCPSLTEITIPESVESIGTNAFANCRKLSVAIINAEKPPQLGQTVFPKTNLTIKVPKSEGHEILNKYRTASGWKDFGDLIIEQD